jgi:hypothetical protein
MLALSPGEGNIAETRVGRRRVGALNLRTYGWAEKRIFGRTQALVSDVRSEAKRRPEEVLRPRPQHQVILVAADPNDPTVGREHVRKGWPRGLWIRGEDGSPQFVAYEVVEAGAPAGTGFRASATTTRLLLEEGRQRGLR